MRFRNASALPVRLSPSYHHLTYYARQAYGTLSNVMLEVEGSPEKVIEQLIRSGSPARLACGDQSPAAFITGHNTTAAE